MYTSYGSLQDLCVLSGKLHNTISTNSQYYLSDRLSRDKTVLRSMAQEEFWQHLKANEKDRKRELH